MMLGTLASFRWYFRGRGPALWVIATWIAVPVLAVLTWDVYLEFPGVAGDTVLTARVSLPILGILVSVWLLTPALPSLDARGRPEIRVFGSVCILCVIAAAAASTALVVLWVTHAPSQFVPRDFVGDDDIRLLLWPLIDNVIVVGAAASLCFCAFGRSGGVLASVTVYVGLVMVGANPHWYQMVPYYSHGIGVPVTSHPVAAAALTFAGVLVWFRTSGSTMWTRET